MAAPVSPALFDQFARGWRGYALIALLALVSGVLGIASVPALDADEAHFALATRELMEAPTPGRAAAPGAHALQGMFVSIVSPHRLNVIWPYRLASVLALMLAAIACFWGGRALIGSRPAFLGAGLFATGLLASFEAMIATPTALLIAFVTVAMAALARLYAAPAASPRVRALLFWAAFASAFAIDAAAPVFAAGLTLAALALWERRAAWAKPLLWWPGPALALLLIGAQVAAGGQISSSLRFFDSQHLALPGYHLLLLPLLIFPATYALPAAARIVFDVIRAPHGAHAPARFLIAWSAPLLALFELWPSKLPSHALPAYPAIALLCGAGLAAMPDARWRTAHPAGLVLFGVSGFVLVGLLAAGATFMPGDLGSDVRRAISAGLIAALIIAAAIAGLIALQRPAARAGVLAASALMLSFSLREHILPEAREFNVSGEAVAALTRARLAPREDRTLWIIGYREASIVLLTRGARRLATPDEAGAQARSDDAVLIEGRAMPILQAALQARGLAFAAAEPPVRGVTLDNGRRVALFVGRVETDATAAADDQPQSP